MSISISLAFVEPDVTTFYQGKSPASTKVVPKVSAYCNDNSFDQYKILNFTFSREKNIVKSTMDLQQSLSI